jgi:hypothetical protein
MPTDEELQAAVDKALEKANKDAATALEKAVKEAKDGKFTQEDLDRVAGETRKAGREAAEKELLKELGVESREDIGAILKAAKDAEDSQKTELQKTQDELVKARETAEAAQAEARNSRINTALTLSVRDAGVNPDRLAAALRLVDVSKLEVKGDEVVGLEEAVKGLKEQSPEWFGTKFSPPDASGGGREPVDYRTASVEDRDKALAKLNVRL